MVQLIDEFLDSCEDTKLRYERVKLRAMEERIPEFLLPSLIRGIMKQRGLERNQIDHRMKVLGIYTVRTARKPVGLPVESSRQKATEQDEGELYQQQYERDQVQAARALPEFVTLDPNEFEQKDKIKFLKSSPIKLYIDWDKYDIARIE